MRNEKTNVSATTAIIPVQRRRKLWIHLHRLLAIGAGFLFAILGLTGSVSVYREEIDLFLNPKLAVEHGTAPYRSLDALLEAVRLEHPTRHGSWTLEMPTSTNGMVTAWFDKPRETFFEWHAPLMVSVNPYTAQVIANRFWGSTVTTWLTDVHSNLLLEISGRRLVGNLGILLLISIGTGLYLWHPFEQGFWRAFAVRRQFGFMRWVGDLHRLLGVGVAPALLVLALTGYFLSNPKSLQSLTGATGMNHGETGRVIVGSGVPNGRPISLEAALFIARAPFPDAELRRITTPAGANGTYQIEFHQADEVNRRHPFTTVWVDRWSGHILEVRNPQTFSFGETIAEWMWPLHSGEVLGKTGRFYWFIAGQALFWLYALGILRWLIRKGRVADRPVDFSLTKNIGHLIFEKFRRFTLIALRWLWLSLKRASVKAIRLSKKSVAQLRAPDSFEN